jgi:FkbM family methyltransferase
MNSPSFDSYAQNGEDVVLWRALRGVDQGRYIEVGANHPRHDSVSMAFYAKGWSGITVEPDPQFADLHRQQRPRDLLVQAAITAEDNGTATLHIVDGTGLSTLDDVYSDQHANAGRKIHDLMVPTRRLDGILQEAGWAGHDIHFMSVDTEGSERSVLESIDLSVWRPWILVIEATAPNSTNSTRVAWESIVTDAGYRLCLFDGLSCFYVADERSAQLAHTLSYPACILDNYTTLTLRDWVQRADSAQQAVDGLVHDLVRWRARAISGWAAAMANGPLAASLRAQLATLQAQHDALGRQHHEATAQLAAMYQSSSWRVTKPLRSVGAKVARVRGNR